MLLPPAARRRLRLWLLLDCRVQGSHSTTALRLPARGTDSALLRKVGVPPGAPRRALQASWPAPACGAGTPDRDPGRMCWGMARGSSANHRALLGPPDVARLKMLQPWTAPRSASQVQGAAAEGGSAAGKATVSQGDGKRERGETGPLESQLPPSRLGQRLPGWLARYRELQRSLNELALLAWPADALS